MDVIGYLESKNFSFDKKTAVILGRNDELASNLLDKGMTVSVCGEKSDKSIVSGMLQEADLVVSLTDRPHFFTRTQCWNAVVIDVVGNSFEEKPELLNFYHLPSWSYNNK